MTRQVCLLVRPLIYWLDLSRFRPPSHLAVTFPQHRWIWCTSRSRCAYPGHAERDSDSRHTRRARSTRCRTRRQMCVSAHYGTLTIITTIHLSHRITPTTLRYICRRRLRRDRHTIPIHCRQRTLAPRSFGRDRRQESSLVHPSVSQL